MARNVSMEADFIYGTLRRQCNGNAISRYYDLRRSP